MIKSVTLHWTIKMLTTVQIMAILEDVPWFNGVYPIDRLPLTLGKKRGIIINLDESHKEGSHWVSLYLDDKRIAHYFDSFGRKPQGQILIFIERVSNYYLYNPKKYQGNLSIACGSFCILFILSAENLNNFYKLFHECDHIDNENKLFINLKKFLM